MNAPLADAGAATFMDWLADGGGHARDWLPEATDDPGGERPVLGYACRCVPLRPIGGLRRVVAKTYGDELGATAFAAMSALREAAMVARTATLRIPRALRYDARRRCLLQERAPGCSLGALLAGGDLPWNMRVAGRALAELHSLACDGRPAPGLSGHIDALMRPHPGQLAQACPAWRTHIEAIIAALDQALPEEVAPVPLHRDFHPRQIFINGAQGWIIDWDLHACGDPALDVGNFLMSLRLKGLPAAAGAAFMLGYGQVRDDPAMQGRIWIYRAFNYLRRACKHFRQGQADAAQQVADMLAAAEHEIETHLRRGTKA